MPSRVTANDQELASINRLADNYAMVRDPNGVANRYTRLAEIGKGEGARALVNDFDYR